MSEEVVIVGNTGYANHTTVCALGLIAVVVLGLSVLFLPRRWSVLPILVMACFVSSAQRIVIAGMDFDFLRIMLLFGLVRLILHREYNTFIWGSIDTAMILWVTSSTLFYILHLGDFTSVVNRLGFALNSFGMYLLFRCLIRDWSDLDQFVVGFILISIPVAVFFLVEDQTGRNLFYVFGGVPAITMIRDGSLRCQGAFSHPILAGCFWASLIPLFASCWWKSEKGRAWAITGLTTSSIIVFCCASSTPIMGVLAAVIGGLFFFLRRKMRIVRWSLLVILIGLHLMMKGPVWSLIARVSSLGGSTGWHRYNLINQAIVHFGDWWFSGCSGQTIEAWGVFAGDVTNQYVLEGVTGGFATLCFFVVLIAVAFREVGKLWRLQMRNPYRLALSWAVGVSLFVHCINFIGVSYFGQILLLWYLILAIIGSLSVQAKPVKAASRPSSINRSMSHRRSLIVRTQ